VRLVEPSRMVLGDWSEHRRALLGMELGLPWLTEALRFDGEAIDTCARWQHLNVMKTFMKQPLFAGLRIEHIDLLARDSSVVTYAPGEVILTKGESAIALKLGDDDGRLGSIMSLFLRCTQPQDVVAKKEGCWIKLTRSGLDALFEDAPDAAWRVLERICRDAQGSNVSHGVDALQSRISVSVPQQRALPYSELIRLMASLEQISAFRDVSMRTLIAVLRCARECRFNPGATLVEEGRIESMLFILVEGEAKVLKKGRAIARLQAPTVFGELAAIAGAPRNAQVVAEDPCYALALPKEALYSLMLDDRAVVDLMLDMVVRRMAA
ncbi:MAG: cyclic nucleotide-binding domain-containing protein, partial [Myxococcota bacterium]